MTNLPLSSDDADEVKRPAYQWYPGDFRRDVALQACSFGARALWREMLDLMHDGEPYGYLTAGGVPIDAATLARIVGIPVAQCRKWLGQLEDRKVFSRADDVIYSRRMVKDERLRDARAECGKLGGNRDLGVDYNEPGFVYAMLRHPDGHIKIGISKAPEKRRWRIAQQYPNQTITLLAKCWVSDMGTAEARLHEHFAHCKSGEWFALSPDERAELLNVHLKENERVNGGETPPPASSSAFASAFAENNAVVDSLTALSVWCNSAITERWGESLNPLRRDQCASLVVAVQHVEDAVVRESIYAQCRGSKKTEPPKHPNYFQSGILAAWEEEVARRVLAASGEVPPAIRVTKPSSPRPTTKSDRTNAELTEFVNNGK